MANQQQPQLKPEVAAKFKLHKMAYAGEVNSPKYGMVNMAKIDLKKAKILAADTGFPWLVPLEVAESEKTTAKDVTPKKKR